MDLRLLATRDQFALRSLSNDQLKLILPLLSAAADRIAERLEAYPPEDEPLARQVRLQDELAVIVEILGAVADRIAEVLPDGEVAAFYAGLEQAAATLRAAGVETLQAPPGTPAGILRAGDQIVPVIDPTTGFGVAITPEQLEAVARGNGFASFPGLPVGTPGRGIDYTIETATARWTASGAAAIRQQLEEGFLLGRSSQEIARGVRQHLQGASRAQAEAIVRTSMAQAAQTAHDAFYAANEDALGDREGNRYVWDASHDGRLCFRCAALDGRRYRNREDAPWPAHWNCRCKILPITPLADMLEALPSSYLESTPVQYDASGKRLPPPEGYDQRAGDPAYARPRKVNGEMVWQRRRTLPAGATTAGSMLQRANDQTAVEVLGSRKRLARFRALTGRGGRFVDDPQGALIEMLRPAP